MSEQDLADQDVLTHLTHAFTLFMDGDPVGARLAAQFAMEAVPISGPAQAALGDRLLSINDALGAEAALRTACDLGTRDANTLARLARSIAEQGRHDEATTHYQGVLCLDPAHSEALIHLGRSALRAGRSRQALAMLRRAALLSRDNASLWLLLAGVAHTAGDAALSERARRVAYVLDPGNPAACLAMAETALAQGRQRTGRNALIRASRLDPTDPGLLSHCLRAGHLVAGQTPDRLARLHRGWHNRFGTPVPPRPPVRARAEEPPRLGLVVPEPPDPLLNWRLRPLLRHRDAARLSVIVFAGPSASGQPWEDLKPLADAWVDYSGLSVGALAHRIRTHRIDILADLSGHGCALPLTLYARHRPAPVQVAWSRYPGTTGLRVFDALLTDRGHCPPDHESFHSEPVVCLDAGALACEPPCPMPAPGPAPRTVTRVLTLGSLAPPSLVGEACLDLWASVLRAIPGAHLAMLDPAWRAPSARNGLREAMRSRGLDPTRLRDGAPADPTQPWDALPALDAVLDSVPVSHDSGAIMALAVGIPLVTLPGSTPGSRFAAAHLNLTGRARGIAEDASDFVIRVQRAAAQPRQPVRWDGAAWTDEFSRTLDRLFRAAATPAKTVAGDAAPFSWTDADMEDAIAP